MIVDSDNEVLNGVIYTLDGRFKGHFNLGLGGGCRIRKKTWLGKTVRCITGIESSICGVKT